VISLSRRNLLASVSSLLLSTAADANLSFDDAVSARSGRINLGLSGLTYYYYLAFYSFLNAWKSGAPIQVINNGVSYWSNIPPGSPNSAWGRFLDDDGELVAPLPAGTTQMERIFYSSPRDGLPDGFNRIGEPWVLKWDGMASAVSVVHASSQVRMGNRIEWAWGVNEGQQRVVFSGIDLNVPPRNIRLCEARHEALLDAGELFNPDWLAKVREGSGIVRFMGWQNTNGDLATLRFSDIPNENYCSYGGDSSTPLIRGGMPVTIMSALANKVQSHPWVCIPHAFGTKKLTAITNVTNAKPVLVTSPGHNWENGEKVLIYQVSGMTQLNQNVYTVANSDPKGGTLELAGVDSTGFGAYTSSGLLASPYNLDDIAREVALLAAHFRDHVDPALVTYFELSNETWNSIFNQSHWFVAQGKQLFGSAGFWNQMSGYIAAHCMKVIRDTYGVENRHKWKGVLPTQTIIDVGVTHRYIAGINRYIREHASALRITDLFDDLAVTGYFAGGHFTNALKATVFRWMDESESRWQAGQESTKYSYFNRIVNEDIADGRHTPSAYSVNKLAAFWQAQMTIANANGLGLIQYEGGNGNVADFSPPLVMEERARFLEFYKQCNHTPEDAANYTAMFNRFIELGGKYPCKFVEAGPVGYFGAWGGLRYLADSNPVWDSVVKFNGRA
jgi:hypothetical protein